MDKVKYVVKHTDNEEFIRFRKVSAYWVEEVREATHFDSKDEAENEIIVRCIPYVHAVEVI